MLHPNTRRGRARPLHLAQPFYRWVAPWTVSRTFLFLVRDKHFAGSHQQMACAHWPVICNYIECCNSDSLLRRSTSWRSPRLYSSNRRNGRKDQKIPQWKPCSVSRRRRWLSCAQWKRTCNYRIPSRSLEKYDRSPLPSCFLAIRCARCQRCSQEREWVLGGRVHRIWKRLLPDWLHRTEGPTHFRPRHQFVGKLLSHLSRSRPECGP